MQVNTKHYPAVSINCLFNITQKSCQVKCDYSWKKSVNMKGCLLSCWGYGGSVLIMDAPIFKKLLWIFAVLLYLPYIIGWTYEDDKNWYRETRHGPVVGGGSYVFRGICGGVYRRNFFEGGYQFEQKTTGSTRWGVKAQASGWSTEPSDGEDDSGFFIIQPRIAVDTRPFLFGFGTGVLFIEDEVVPWPSLSLRLGTENEVHVYASLLDGSPVFAEGLLQAGLGARVDKETRIRIGTDILPYTGWGLALGLERFLSGGKSVLTIGTRFGSGDAGKPEFGLSLKIAARTVEVYPKPIPPPPIPQPAPLEKPDLAKLLSVIEPIRFETAKADLTRNAEELIEKYAAVLARNPTATVIVEGHCDERGSTEFNEKLGEGRAMSIVRALVAHGVQRERLRIQSKGKSMPLDPGHNEDAWARNRRVEIHPSP